jgi:putative Mg2+ transporter-C (MgtC) family protein
MLWALTAQADALVRGIGMISEWEMIGRLLLAAVLGSLIGLQREHQFWTAGLRTHMLVATGACLFMTVSAFGFQQALTQPGTQLDPSRIAAQIVTGIGFLGAGSIMMRGEVIKGLNTAASLWAVAAIGMSIGGGMYVLGVAAIVLILAILIAIGPIEHRYRDYIKVHVIKLVAPTGVLNRKSLEAFLGVDAVRLKEVLVEQGPQMGTESVTVEFKKTSRVETAELLKRILTIPEVREEPAPH